jgi:hypothetical protein
MLAAAAKEPLPCTDQQQLAEEEVLAVEAGEGSNSDGDGGDKPVARGLKPQELVWVNKVSFSPHTAQHTHTTVIVLLLAPDTLALIVL